MFARFTCLRACFMVIKFVYVLLKVSVVNQIVKKSKNQNNVKVKKKKECTSHLFLTPHTASF